MINLNQLRVFYESAKCLSFSRAAEHLYISQPAVSSQIKNLESMLRIQLFNKVGRRMYLTESGKVLMDYASKIFYLENEAEKALCEIKDLKRGALYIGTTKTYARYLMPNFVSVFHSLYPHIVLHLSEGSSREMMQSLFALKNELAIVASSSYLKSLQTISFGKEEILLVVSPDHPLAARGFVTIEELSKTPIIMREEGSGTRRVVTDMFQKRHLVPTVFYEASNLGCIKELLIKGEGASFIVRCAVEEEIKRSVLSEVRIEGITLNLDVNIVYLKDGSLSQSAQAFLDVILRNSNNEEGLFRYGEEK